MKLERFQDQIFFAVTRITMPSESDGTSSIGTGFIVRCPVGNKAAFFEVFQMCPLKLYFPFWAYYEYLPWHGCPIINELTCHWIKSVRPNQMPKVRPLQ